MKEIFNFPFFRISTARKIAFNPCFSPTVSDDESSVHEEEILPTSSGFDVSFMNPFRKTATPTRELSTRTINETSSHSVIPRPIASVAGSAFRAARDLRARLSLVAHSENQQNGQASLNRLSTGKYENFESYHLFVGYLKKCKIGNLSSTFDFLLNFELKFDFATFWSPKFDNLVPKI